MTNRENPPVEGMSEEQLIQLMMQMMTGEEGGAYPLLDELAIMQTMLQGEDVPRMQPPFHFPICHTLDEYDIVDAQAMHKLHPTFRVPSIEESRSVVPGDKVKIGIPGETFWTKVKYKQKKK